MLLSWSGKTSKASAFLLDIVQNICEFLLGMNAPNFVHTPKKEVVQLITDFKFIGRVESKTNNLKKKFSCCSFYIIFSKIGRFHQHCKNFAETLQFEDLAVKIFFLFYYELIFVTKILNWYQRHFLWMLKKLKAFLGKKGQCVRRA